MSLSIRTCRPRYVAVFGVFLGLVVPSSVAMASGRSTAVTTCPVVYTARPGDSWNRIASRSGIPIAEVLKLNKAKKTSLILIGDRVCLPATSSIGVGTTTTTAPKAARRFTVAESRAIIRDVFPPRLRAKALEIAQRESHTNAANYSWCCYGLFQIYYEANKSWLNAMGVRSPSDLLDARVNAEAALMMYKRNSGWSPWNLN